MDTPRPLGRCRRGTAGPSPATMPPTEGSWGRAWSVAKSPSGSLCLARAGPVPSWERSDGSGAEALTQIFYLVLN